MINVRYTTTDQTIVAWETLDGGQASALVSSSEVQEFILAGGQITPYSAPIIDPKVQAKAELAATDKEMARIAEDLIQTLISKGVIAESDIPAPARDKMDRRAKLRAGLA